MVAGLFFSSTQMVQAEVPTSSGYDMGSPSLERSPVSMEKFELLKKTVFFTDDDIASLKKAQQILEPQINDILDVWYGYVGANPHLLALLY
jgi:hypothetical protein|tara:strand:- start:497 stop:769 length:273 start_codon:yes stop_codon:yes gene_type:complete